MTLTINLPTATLEKLQAQSAACGKDIDTFVREAVEAKLIVSGLLLGKILEPIHRETEASGMSESDVESLVDDAVARVRAQRSTPRNEP